MALTTDDIDRITDKVTIAVNDAVSTSMETHRDKEHKPLKAEVRGHSRLFWLTQGFWAGIVAYMKYKLGGGK